MRLKHREKAVQGHTGRSWPWSSIQVLTHHTQNTVTPFRNQVPLFNCTARYLMNNVLLDKE